MEGIGARGMRRQLTNSCRLRPLRSLRPSRLAFWSRDGTDFPDLARDVQVNDVGHLAAGVPLVTLNRQGRGLVQENGRTTPSANTRVPAPFAYAHFAEARRLWRRAGNLERQTTTVVSSGASQEAPIDSLGLPFSGVDR